MEYFDEFLSVENATVAHGEVVHGGASASVAVLEQLEREKDDAIAQLNQAR